MTWDANHVSQQTTLDCLEQWRCFAVGTGNARVVKSDARMRALLMQDIKDPDELSTILGLKTINLHPNRDPPPP